MFLSWSQHRDHLLEKGLLVAVDFGLCVILMMLDLRAAFDTADLSILLDCSEYEVSIRGTVLKWFDSYLLDRTFSVTIAKLFFFVALNRIWSFSGFVYGVCVGLCSAVMCTWVCWCSVMSLFFDFLPVKHFGQFCCF